MEDYIVHDLDAGEIEHCDSEAEAFRAALGMAEEALKPCTTVGEVSTLDQIAVYKLVAQIDVDIKEEAPRESKISISRQQNQNEIITHNKITALEATIAELKEKLKLKTQNEIDASVNADCLAGSRVIIERLKNTVRKAEKRSEDYRQHLTGISYKQLENGDILIDKQESMWFVAAMNIAREHNKEIKQARREKKN